jgi:hypothetical protein
VKCKVDGCEKDVKDRGLCAEHYLLALLAWLGEKPKSILIQEKENENARQALV